MAHDKFICNRLKLREKLRDHGLDKPLDDHELALQLLDHDLAIERIEDAITEIVYTLGDHNMFIPADVADQDELLNLDDDMLGNGDIKGGE